MFRVHPKTESKTVKNNVKIEKCISEDVHGVIYKFSFSILVSEINLLLRLFRTFKYHSANCQPT